MGKVTQLVSSSVKESSFWLIGISLLLINLSSDHILIHSNLLKLCILSFIVFVWSFFAFSNSRQTIALSINNPLFLFLLPLLGFLPGILLNQTWLAHHQQVSAATFLTCSLLGYLVCKAIVEKQKVHQHLFLPFLLVSLYVVFIGLAEAFGLKPLVRFYLNPFDVFHQELTPIFSGLKSNIEATFGNKNYFGCWVVMMLPTISALTFANKPKSNFFRLVFLVLILGLFVCLVLINSRGALFGFFCSTIPLFFYLYREHQKNNHKKLVFFLVGLLFIGFLVCFYSPINSKIASLGDYQTWSARFVPWAASINSFSENIWFGGGFGASYTDFFRFADPLRELYGIKSKYRHAHNELLEVLQEGGLLGFFAYVFFWTYVFRVGFKIVFNPNEQLVNQYVVLGAICGLVGYHMHSLVTVANQMIAPRSMAYVLAGIIIGLYQKKTQGEKIELLPKYLVSLVLILLSVLAIILTFKAASSHWAIKKYVDNPTIEINTESRDVYYLLFVASELAVKDANTYRYRDVAEQLHEVIPYYEDALYHKALFHFSRKEFEDSKVILRESQRRNLYRNNLIDLGLAISVLDKDRVLFEEQFKLLLASAICKKVKSIDCRNKQPNVVLKMHSQAITFSQSKNEFSVLVHPAYFGFVKKLLIRSTSISESDKVSFFSSQLSKVIDNEYFFLNSLKRNPALAENITKYFEVTKKQSNNNTEFHKKLKNDAQSSLFQQIKNYREAKIEMEEANDLIKKEILSLEQSINSEIDLNDFLQRRNLMTDIAGRLINSAAYLNRLPNL